MTINTGYFRGNEFRYDDFGNSFFEMGEKNVRELLWHPNPGDVVFDIGAADGIYTLSAAAMGATVYAFEPKTDAYEKLVKNISLNPAFKIKAEKMGVIHNLPDNRLVNFSNAASSFIVSNKDHVDEALVPVTTVDNYVNDNRIQAVDWLKIDVEGSEMEVLYGAKETLQKFHPNVLVEAHSCFLDVNPQTRERYYVYGGPITEVIAKHIRQLGYTLTFFNVLGNDRCRPDLTRRHKITWYYGALMFFQVLEGESIEEFVADEKIHTMSEY